MAPSKSELLDIIKRNKSRKKNQMGDFFLRNSWPARANISLIVTILISNKDIDSVSKHIKKKYLSE